MSRRQRNESSGWRCALNVSATQNFLAKSLSAPFIVDFASRRLGLVIEIDGDTHDMTDENELRRTRFLEKQGYWIMRFTNSDVMNNLEGVLRAIEEKLQDSPLPSPIPGGERE